MADIFAIETPSLGDRSYVVTDGSLAVVVDPQRDIDRVLPVVEERGLTLAAVAETHLHNDYVSGGLELARRSGADYLVAADDDVEFARRPVRDGEAIEVGALVLHVRATPGHTEHHVSYVLESDGEVQAVFTGGSLLYGATGRTDLVRPELTELLTRRQHASARRLGDSLPASAAVFPTHGFGSFCSAGGSADRTSSTLGLEQRDNSVFRLGEDAFVAETLAGLDAYPAYYDHMGPINAAGPSPVDLSTARRADAQEVSRRIGAGEWVVDLRPPAEFAARHVVGTLSFALDDSMASYLGWLVPWGAPVTLLGTDDPQVAAAQRELVRIGVDRPVAAAVGGPEQWAGDRPIGSFGTAGFADLAEAISRDDVVVLDVRAASEWESSHVQGAVHIPVYELPRRLDEVPSGQVWVHCASGYRATVAASLLSRAGRDVVSVLDDYTEGVAAVRSA